MRCFNFDVRLDPLRRLADRRISAPRPPRFAIPGATAYIAMHKQRGRLRAAIAPA
jgi:hypothetical protein